MATQQIKGVIDEKVINLLINLVQDIIGDKAVKIALKNMNVSGKVEGRKIIFAFSDQMQKMLGRNGAFASMRQVGRELAKFMMKQYPREEWEIVLENALNDFGFARRIDKHKDKAFICNCVFYEILEKNNLAPVSHAVCWAGWGFIEGFVKEIEGAKGIKWVSRDYENEMCRFDFIK